MNEKRAVVRSVIDRWTDLNGPNGLLKLAEKSGVSSSTIERVRLGYVPGRSRTRSALCNALNIKESKLFPGVGASEEEAS